MSLKQKGGDLCQREEDELVWWPPQPVLELARLAVDSGGDPAAIQRALDPTMITVSLLFIFAFSNCQFLMYVIAFCA